MTRGNSSTIRRDRPNIVLLNQPYDWGAFFDFVHTLGARVGLTLRTLQSDQCTTRIRSNLRVQVVATLFDRFAYG